MATNRTHPSRRPLESKILKQTITEDEEHTITTTGTVRTREARRWKSDCTGTVTVGKRKQIPNLRIPKAWTDAEESDEEDSRMWADSDYEIDGDKPEEMATNQTRRTSKVRSFFQRIRWSRQDPTEEIQQLLFNYREPVRRTTYPLLAGPLGKISALCNPHPAKARKDSLLDDDHSEQQYAQRMTYIKSLRCAREAAEPIEAIHRSGLLTYERHDIVGGRAVDVHQDTDWAARAQRAERFGIFMGIGISRSGSLPLRVSELGGTEVSPQGLEQRTRSLSSPQLSLTPLTFTTMMPDHQSSRPTPPSLPMTPSSPLITSPTPFPAPPSHHPPHPPTTLTPLQKSLLTYTHTTLTSLLDALPVHYTVLSFPLSSLIRRLQLLAPLLAQKETEPTDDQLWARRQRVMQLVRVVAGGGLMSGRTAGRERRGRYRSLPGSAEMEEGTQEGMGMGMTEMLEKESQRVEEEMLRVAKRVDEWREEERSTVAVRELVERWDRGEDGVVVRRWRGVRREVGRWRRRGSV